MIDEPNEIIYPAYVYEAKVREGKRDATTEPYNLLQVLYVGRYDKQWHSSECSVELLNFAIADSVQVMQARKDGGEAVLVITSTGDQFIAVSCDDFAKFRLTHCFGFKVIPRFGTTSNSVRTRYYCCNNLCGTLRTQRIYGYWEGTRCGTS